MSILVVIEVTYLNELISNYQKNPSPFAKYFLNFWYLHEISNILKKKKKNDPHRSSISEIIDSGRCAYLNA